MMKGIKCRRCTEHSSVTRGGEGRFSGGMVDDEADGGTKGPERVVLPSEACKRNTECAGKWSNEVGS